MANVFEIVETVKKEQALTEVTMTQFAAGDTPHHHNRKVIQRDGKIDKPKQRFSWNPISVEEYLSGVFAHTNV